MQKKVTFNKEIPFDTNIDEINSISLEYEVDTKKDSLISGKFIVSGDYRMTNVSENLDSFDHELPFSINLDKKYDIDDADVDISDFYYEVINSKILSVNIELTIDNIEEREVEEVEKEIEEIADDVEEVIDNTKSLFDDLDTAETYTTYKIHIVTENDTIESIMMDYQVKKEDIENYNDIKDMKIGDKVIIPANEN